MSGRGDAVRPPRRRWRAALALAAVAGFFVLVLALMVGTVALLFALVAAGRFRPQHLAAVLLVFVLGRALVTAFARHGGDVPGIPVDRRQQPRLWAVVDDVARLTRAPTPDVLYLLAEPTAWASQQSRALGLLGGRREMGLGLTALAALSVDEVRAVVAHELGHLHQPHRRLGAVVYRTRDAMTRAADDVGQPLETVLAAYRRSFLRFTMQMARDLEAAADESAITAAGPVAQAEALLRMASAQLAYELYVDHYVEPLVAEGRWPIDLVGGFRRILADPARATELARLRAEIIGHEAHPFDSHPPLEQRVAEALSRVATIRTEGGERLPAFDLLEDPDAVEADLAQLLGVAATGDLEGGVSWSAVAEQVWAPLHAEQADVVLAAVAALDDPPEDEDEVEEEGLEDRRAAPEDLLDLLARGDEHGLVRLLLPGFDVLDGIDREQAAPVLLDAALVSVLGTALVERRGCRWQLSASAPIELVDGDGHPIDIDALAAMARLGDRRDEIAAAIAPERGRR